MSMNKPGFYVIVMRSATCCRVWGNPELRHKPIINGPWKRLKTAKKKAQQWRAYRVETVEYFGGPVTDHGPTCSSVKIVEVKE